MEREKIKERKSLDQQLTNKISIVKLATSLRSDSQKEKNHKKDWDKNQELQSIVPNEVNTNSPNQPKSNKPST